MMLLLSPDHWSDYELLDSGGFEKLERYGAFVLSRPEPKAVWGKSLPDAEWRRLQHTSYVAGAGFGRMGKEDSGTWRRAKTMPDQWTVGYGRGALQFRLRLGLTAFKHIGVFPEQAPNWEYIYAAVRSLPVVRPKVLNLFAYTGASTLAARAAGAEVTHLDAVRQVVAWARDNATLNAFDDVRWVVDDALKFVRREARRQHLYHGLILDPPAYGHGPNGEKWKLDERLWELLQACADILLPSDSFCVLTLYSNGFSSLVADTSVAAAFGQSREQESGELFLQDPFGKRLPLSVFTRFKR
ncbi:MAG: class I SAM-dependent methyltransferase [Prevotellaceae bacterium]|jgi:23S rRNA (cytosine1962-C5)-methyltransferase|nr:class I SAM-dependent methyltransferase [Prevotellaceae bacterium]